MREARRSESASALSEHWIVERSGASKLLAEPVFSARVQRSGRAAPYGQPIAFQKSSRQ